MHMLLIETLKIEFLIEFLICSQLLIAFLAAGVRKVLRSLLPLPTTDKISLFT